jgi:hypothetical protein
MVDAVGVAGETAKRPPLEVQPNLVAVLLFLALLAAGVLFAAYSLEQDIVQSGTPSATVPHRPLPDRGDQPGPPASARHRGER